MKDEKEQLTLYQKGLIIEKVSNLLESYEESENKKATIKAAHLLIDKVRYNDTEFITLESDFIEEILFILNEDGTKSIARDVFHKLRALDADLKGVSFDNVHISGFYFNGLRNVEIDIQKIPNSDISNTFLEGVKINGTLDGANIEGTDFTGYIGELELDPQLVQNKNLRMTCINGITVNGSFDGVNVSCMKTKGFKGKIIINPQKVYIKDICGIDFNRVQLVGDYNEVSGTYDDPCFENCRLYETSFKGCIGNVVIPLDKLYLGAPLCNFTGVKLTGKIAEKNDISLQYSYYEDENGKKIYLPYDKYVSEDTHEDEIIEEKKDTHKCKSRKLTLLEEFKKKLSFF